MILLRLSAFVLGAGLQIQPQTPPVPVPIPVTEVMVMTKLKPGVALSDVANIMQEEVRARPFSFISMGRSEQWFTRGDGKGAVFFLRCKTTEEAQAILAGLPAVKAGYLDVEYIPVGPFSRLRVLVKPQSPTDGATPR